jgi:hypothetical protein
MLTLVPIAPPINIAQLGATDWETRAATAAEITHGKIDCLPRQRVGSKVATNDAGSNAAAMASGPPGASGRP